MVYNQCEAESYTCPVKPLLKVLSQLLDVTCRGSMHDVEGQSHIPQVIGLALMHPCFAGEARPQLARLLGHSR